MEQYPVQVNFEFEVDLDITEEQISSVKTSIITKNIAEESISSHISEIVPSYRDVLYVYGKNAGEPEELILVSGLSPDFLRRYGYLPPGHEWRVKYYTTGSPAPGDGTIVTYWWDDDHRQSSTIWNNNTYKFDTYANFILATDNPVYPESPDHTIQLPLAKKSETTPSSPVAPYVKLPYDTYIKIKRNTGETLENINNINENEEVPNTYTFPNLELYQPTVIGDSNINLNKIWIKLSDQKYRLKVYGFFFKYTDKKPRTVDNEYIVGEYIYTPNYRQSGSYYISEFLESSRTESTETITLYEPEYNPTDVKLMVTYINRKGQNEIRHYST